MKTIHTMLRWFGWSRRKTTLKDVQPEQLRRERLHVERTEVKLTREIEELEKQKEELFRKGVDGTSDRQRVQIARKIKQLDAQVQAKDRQLALVAKNLQVLNSVAQLKENERILKDLGMEGVVNKMDLGEVQSYIESATVEGQFQMERFTRLMQSVSDAESLYESDEDDSETQAILDIMSAASRGRTDTNIRDGLSQVDQLLHKVPTDS
ncbi:MAG: hypothetical protein KDA83_20880 [Planctomycetales bacterium]|nr:hypothetical protein [Planctomycetales bacterium]